MSASLLVAGSASGADDLTVKEMQAARNTYVAKCAKCHRFYDPLAYSEPGWQAWLEKMNRKSKLKPDQAILLRRYLAAYRAGRLSSKPEAKPGEPHAADQ